MTTALVAVTFSLAILLSGPIKKTATRTQASPAEYVPKLVGRTFLRAIAEKDFETARSLAADTVSFDGKWSRTPNDVSASLRALIKRVPMAMAFKKVIAMEYDQAVARFGPPPKRLVGVKLKGATVVLGRLGRGGLIVILNRIEGRFRVTALLD